MRGDLLSIIRHGISGPNGNPQLGNFAQEQMAITKSKEYCRNHVAPVTSISEMDITVLGGFILRYAERHGGTLIGATPAHAKVLSMFASLEQ